MSCVMPVYDVLMCIHTVVKGTRYVATVVLVHQAVEEQSLCGVRGSYRNECEKERWHAVTISHHLTMCCARFRCQRA